MRILTDIVKTVRRFKTRRFTEPNRQESFLVSNDLSSRADINEMSFLHRSISVAYLLTLSCTMQKKAPADRVFIIVFFFSLFSRLEVFPPLLFIPLRDPRQTMTKMPTLNSYDFK